MLRFILLGLPFVANAVSGDKLQNNSWPVNDESSVRWVSQLMPLAMSTFYPWSSKNEICTFQGLLYKQHLSNLTLWAVQMLDSSVMAESGIVSGSDYNFGNYDQCVKIHVQEYNMYGKHCLANLHFAPRYFNDTEDNSLLYKSPGPFSSVWEKVKRVKDPRIKHRDNFYWSVCIPSGCDHTDLEESLRSAITPLFEKSNISVNVTVDKFNCEEENPSVKLTSGTLAYLFTMAGFILLTFIATLLHHFVYKNEEKEIKDNLLLSFSLLKNFPALFEPEKKQELQFISGIKVLSMFCIIYGHRMLISYAFPVLNAEDHEQRTTELIETINLSGNVIVNTFLHVTGFLMFTKLLNDMTKKRNINIIFYLIYKWARTTPIYVVIICSFLFLKPLKTNEPLWRSQGLSRLEACRNNFWSHILYINNYYDPGAECLLPSWYLAVDMQMFIVCVIIGYIMSKLKKFGYFLLGCSLMISLLIPSVVVFYKGYEPILKLYINFVRNYRNEDDYVNAYVPTHMRAAPYICGMVTAIVAHKLQKKEFHFKSGQMIIGLLITAILLLGTLFSSWIFYMPDRIPTDIERIVYPFVQRMTWSLGISWLIISSFLNGYGYIIKRILSCSIFIPLNKLTLCVMLIHPLIQGYSLLIQRRPSYVDTSVLVWMAAGDLFISYFLSLIFYLIVETPLAQLQDNILRRIFLKEK
ncbi:nose resistant to fluoxetine protein 6 [Halyomorpha halys]|uniref:nose resistant to fluoxetine protein 6 n=1 Tax=Halyomorpha halys TaxID=286706 RepID=UPI0006D4E2F4|nr:nose resistant to fluoxetine protein 6-like [Halyomorpha halys]